MHSILQAVARGLFHEMIVSRRGEEVLHHTVEALPPRHGHWNPWYHYLDSDLDGVTGESPGQPGGAHFSHARFYVGVLIQTLST
jgi:hypothetical protein